MRKALWLFVVFSFCLPAFADDTPKPTNHSIKVFKVQRHQETQSEIILNSTMVATELQFVGANYRYKVEVSRPTGFDPDGNVTGWRTERYIFKDFRDVIALINYINR